MWNNGFDDVLNKEENDMMEVAVYSERKFELQSPWVLYFKELCAVFEHDPEVLVVYDDETEDAPTVVVHVKNLDKADALRRLLPEEKVFGNVTLKIRVEERKPEEDTDVDLISRAFRDNDILRDIDYIHTEQFGDIFYAVFEPRILQYPADDISDINGYRSVIAADAVKDVLRPVNGVHVCTAKLISGRYPWKNLDRERGKENK